MRRVRPSLVVTRRRQDEAHRGSPPAPCSSGAPAAEASRLAPRPEAPDAPNPCSPTRGSPTSTAVTSSPSAPSRGASATPATSSSSPRRTASAAGSSASTRTSSTSTDERKRLLDALRSLHEQLRPSYGGCRGRRRRAVSHEEPLPPAHDDARWLSGRELRSICLAFLRTAGRAVTLRMLHVVLHRAGYAVDHPHPVKALADALGPRGRCRPGGPGRPRHLCGSRSRRPGAAAEAGGTATIPDW